ncbi:MAG TPA: hypothetical protein VFA04_04560 [Bryobacteraceae bacterium]|nr:hypothetical protein [Bryobacteraceae bacterium]
MAAAAYGHRHAFFTRKVDAVNHISDVGAFHDQRWPAVDHGVIDTASRVVPLVAGPNHGSAQLRNECFNGLG